MPTVTRCYEDNHADRPAGQKAGLYRYLGSYEALLPHQEDGGVYVRTLAAGTTPRCSLNTESSYDGQVGLCT